MKNISPSYCKLLSDKLKLTLGERRKILKSYTNDVEIDDDVDKSCIRMSFVLSFMSSILFSTLLFNMTRRANEKYTISDLRDGDLIYIST
jgi:hypothetical protein